jgi:hypothetical protein
MIMDDKFWSNHFLGGGARERWKGFRRITEMINEDDPSEDASARAKRLTEALRGLLKDELRKHGGAEAFVRWLRSDFNTPSL